MKKVIAMFLVAVIFMFGLCGCGDDSQTTAPNNDKTTNSPATGEQAGNNEQSKAEALKSANVGDYVSFGAYEQDNDFSNGKEEIEWLVLDKKDGKVLVISKYALDCKMFSEKFGSTWEDCMLRQWLNSDFINSAFAQDEKARIPTVTVPAHENPECDADLGDATKDQVFLLSIFEANQYFSSNDARRCEPTEYAVANGAWECGSENFWWWLRTSGQSGFYNAGVFEDGSIYERGFGIEFVDIAVRPALWIDTNA